MYGKAKSQTGKVHYTYHTDLLGEVVEPICNHRTWVGDYWGKPWTPVDDSETVTCKNCIKAAATEGILPLDQELHQLGDEMRREQTRLLKKFQELSVKCPFRKVVNYRTEVHGKKHYEWKCTHPKLDDVNFGWTCDRGDCPHIGYISPCTCEWEDDIKVPPTVAEIQEYERNR